MKKIIAVFTVVIMIFASMVVPVFAEGGGLSKYGDFTYSVNEDGTITIMSFDSFSSLNENVVIPDEIEGRIVTKIREEAFRYASKIKSVVMPDTITEIGTSAFESCINLKTVTLSKGLKKLGISVFAFCRKLEQIELPNGLEEVCDAAFSGCWKLEKIVIPDTVKTIGNLVFDDCKNLKEAKLSDSIKKIGVGLFYDCISLEEIIIPESVESILDIAFFNCKSLKTVTLSKNVKELGENEDPNYLLSEGLQMFVGCSMLEEIIVEPENTNYISVDGVLYDKNKTMLLSYPASKAGETYEVEPSVSIIMPYSLYEVKNLKNIKLPNNLNRLGKYAFAYAEKLEEIDLEYSGFDLGKEAFRNCTSLKNVKLPYDIEAIPFGLFFNCEKLEGIDIPETVKRISPYAFGNCKAITNVAIPEGVESIGYNAFANCTALSNVTIPKTVNMIEDASFAVTALEEVTIPGHLHYLGDSAFAWNPQLTSAYFKGDAPEMWNGLNVFYGASEDFAINIDKGLNDWNNTKHNNYKVVVKTSSGTGDDDNGGGNNTPSGGTSTETDTSIAKGDGNVTVEIKPEIKGDTYVVEISDKIIESVLKEINQNEKLTIEIKGNVSDNINNIEYAISKNMLQKISDKCSGIAMVTSIAKLEFDKNSIEKILADSSENISILIKNASKDALSQDIKDKVADKPAFEFLISSNGKNISDFGKGKVSISIPYILDRSEKASNMIVYYINNAAAEVVKNCKYDSSSKEMKFSTNHFSTYALGYANSDFADVDANSWYADAVGFVASRELFNGDGNNKFSPNSKMTRGMLVTVLGRLDGVNVDGKTSEFLDVDNSKYYAPYIAWVSESGIMSGKGNNKFAPDDTVTREEIAVILTNYAEYLGIDLSAERIDFLDKDKISSWAQDAVSKIQTLNVFTGKPGNLFDPSSDANRAEIATLMMRFIEFLTK